MRGRACGARTHNDHQDTMTTHPEPSTTPTRHAIGEDQSSADAGDEVAAADLPTAQQLARLIDPWVWHAREADQITLGASHEFTTRRAQSLQAAQRVRAWLAPRTSDRPA